MNSYGGLSLPNQPFQNNRFESDEDGYVLEDRPIGNHMIRPIMYRGIHTDSCIKTEDGWICNDICHVEERGGNRLKKTIESPLSISKTLNKEGLKYNWKVQQNYEVRTFVDGRSFRQRDQSVYTKTFGEGACWFKYRAKKKIVECVEQNMANA